MTTRRIGILGGTFDPIHNGHIDAARAADAALGFERLLVVPSNLPPHRPQPIASPFHRFAMAALATVGMDRWQTSDIELRDAARSYTSATLERLHAAGYAPGELVFVLGADAFVEIRSWRNYPDIFDAAHFAIVSRPGTPASCLPARLPELARRMVPVTDIVASGGTSLILIDAPTADVSSTAIRDALSTGRSIASLVPPAVAQYIEQQQLYTTTESAAGSARPSAHRAAGRLHGED